MNLIEHVLFAKLCDTSGELCEIANISFAEFRRGYAELHREFIWLKIQKVCIEIRASYLVVGH